MQNTALLWVGRSRSSAASLAFSYRPFPHRAFDLHTNIAVDDDGVRAIILSNRKRDLPQEESNPAAWRASVTMFIDPPGNWKVFRRRNALATVSQEVRIGGFALAASEPTVRIKLWSGSRSPIFASSVRKGEIPQGISPFRIAWCNWGDSPAATTQVTALGIPPPVKWDTSVTWVSL